MSTAAIASTERCWKCRRHRDLGGELVDDVWMCPWCVKLMDGWFKNYKFSFSAELLLFITRWKA